ncbi:MAG: heavy metal translocating P-type ATPase metal-binding domain-containing protein [Cyclobacteriaceae bacterium]|nr:heavy metal translocating P-type ATPase metal-binding domain-containing protein [Cyclobacteriaceae bacterium]MDH4296575.1 heavy metal translocating P-type ATPase metal-binding domain-containing protein [Cyclobacteriaceae bacterium]MDH5248842.1 heavy metal translocating P-type ATPase metal-binding domain-containing protein [Cyclobacteriaceae bacterium]
MISPALANEGVGTELKCYHCGQRCDETRWLEEKPFCCYGCQTVFEILQTNDLCAYYDLDSLPGTSLKDVEVNSFQYLDDPKIRQKVLTFDSDNFARVTFNIPAIHCISCIWLLENLQRIEKSILRAEVNFARKTVTIDFTPSAISLSKVAGILGSLGYAPQINLDADDVPKPGIDRSLISKLSIAGFCFGNVMLFSFPEYLGIDHADQNLMRFFSWLNFALALPVLFYSASAYFKSAANSFKQGQINIDVPIAAGLLALFLRSSYDIITATGPGYLDSFTGLVFFLLIGRWFQGKTYESLAFDRDFKSYFPLATQKLIADEWKPVVIYALAEGDRMRIRNMEIIPADCTLLDDLAFIDYSFVTGESKPVKAKAGDAVYAGGRLVGRPAEFRVDEKTSQSQLTGLWNNEAFRKVTVSKYQKIIDQAARIFTWSVLGIAIITAAYWHVTNPSQMWLVLTSVLMVACPCALALAAPFTYGSMLRVFGRNQFYLKHADIIEKLASINAVVFDKTGTVTYGKRPDVAFSGLLSSEDFSDVKVLTSASTHPLSILITKAIAGVFSENLSEFREVPGKGIQGLVNGKFLQVGSSEFVGCDAMPDLNASYVFVAINGELRGYFSIRVSVRAYIKNMVDRLGTKCVALLSGDNASDKANMKMLFNPAAELVFNQTPQDKLNFIRKLQQKGRRVLMVGDGLNDSGALKQSDVGIAVTDDTGIFTPACDGILQGDKMYVLDKFLDLARYSTVILKTAFVISFLYNAVALTFAVTGHLTPLVAAILMPLSSISVVGFSTLAVNYTAHKTL